MRIIPWSIDWYSVIEFTGNHTNLVFWCRKEASLANNLWEKQLYIRIISTSLPAISLSSQQSLSLKLGAVIQIRLDL